MQTGREVVVTGLGCITALGVGVKQFWSSLCNGRSGIGPSADPDRAALNDAPVAEIPGYQPADHFNARSQRFMDRISQYALIAASEAIQDAGLEFDAELGERTGIILGNGMGARHTVDGALEDLYAKNIPVPPNTIPKAIISGPSSHISIQYGITGPSWIVSTTCASSNHALGQAWDLIRSGQADVVIAGGTEAPITVPTFKAWQALRILDTVTCRPFSKDRQGLVLGEGAGIIVLEAAEHAQARNARVYCRLAGYGCSSDAYDLTKVSPAGAARAIKTALKTADLEPVDIGYINAHGTGTPLNDSAETAIIHGIFTTHAPNLLISSTKSMHGHALGASGSFEFIAVAKALAEQVIPPTANFTTAGDDCDLDYVPNIARPAEIQAAISNAFGFGGVNAVLAATR